MRRSTTRLNGPSCFCTRCPGSGLTTASSLWTNARLVISTSCSNLNFSSGYKQLDPFLSLSIPLHQVTKSRHTFDRALRSLPLTQHKRIWPLYTDFVRSYELPETTVRVYRRYLKICPEEAEDYIDYLVDIGRLDEAACRLVRVHTN